MSRVITHCRRCGSKRTQTKHGRRCYQCEARGRMRGDREGTRRLPVGPMVPWLLEQVERHGGKGVAAEALGVSERRIYEWTTGATKTIQLDSADRAFCHAGEPTLLRELYPFLYDEVDGRVAA